MQKASCEHAASQSRTVPVPFLWRMMTYAGAGEVAQGASSKAPLVRSQKFFICHGAQGQPDHIAEHAGAANRHSAAQ